MTIIKTNHGLTAALLNTSVADMSVRPVTAEEEYAKNPELKKEDIEALYDWAKSEPNFSFVTERMLILFHHSCHFKMEDTKASIEVFYKLRNNTPEFFNGRYLSKPELKKAVEVLEFAAFPEKDPNGYQIIFHRLKQFEPSKYVFSDGVKLLIMATEACLHVEGTVPGYIFFFDMKGVRLGHLTRLNIGLLRKFFVYVQEGIPVRLKAIHVVNTLPLIDKVMFLIKPFLKKEILSLIHFHSGDYSEIQQFLPKKCLPSDFGGELPSCEELHAQYINWMNDLSEYFEEDEKLRMEEIRKKSQKPPTSKLRQLEID